MHISYSRWSTYAHCPYQHYLSYVEKLERKAPIRALTFGKDFHKLLQHQNNKAEMKKVIRDIKETFGQLPSDQQLALGDNYVDDIKQIFLDYKKYWKDSETPTKTELEFNIPLGAYKGSNITFKGILDELYTPESEEYTIGEHKTFSIKPNLDLLSMNAQVCLYAKAVELLYGKKANAVLWNYIRSTPAIEPLFLKTSNRLSEAKNSNITPFSYARACKKYNLEPQQKMIEEYSNNLDNFFFRRRLDIVPYMVESIWADFKKLAKEIVIKGDTNKRKSISRDCSWCSYRSICYGEFTGADVEYIKSKDFQTKPEREGGYVIDGE